MTPEGTRHGHTQSGLKSTTSLPVPARVSLRNLVSGAKCGSLSRPIFAVKCSGSALARGARDCSMQLRSLLRAICVTSYSSLACESLERECSVRSSEMREPWIGASLKNIGLLIIMIVSDVQGWTT